MSAKLAKSLLLLDVFCFASGAMISSGLFILPGIAYKECGPAVFLAYILASIFALPGVFAQAELVSAMPKTGGQYYFVNRSLGPAVGTVIGLLTWFSLCLKSAFALVGMSAFTHVLLPSVDVHIIAIILCVFFMSLNIFGVKEAGRLQVGLVAALFVILFFYIGFGITSIQVPHFEPFLADDTTMRDLFATVGLVFISYGGILKVGSIAQEVKNPSRTVPLGMLLSLIIVGILYFLVIFTTVGILGDKLLGPDGTGSLTPINDGALQVMGSKGAIFLALAAVLAFVSTANAGIMAASRYLLALSWDKLLPSHFGGVNKKFQTPHTAIIITGVVMIISLLIDLKLLVKAASTVLILTFSFSCLCVIIMRESRLQNYLPKFKSPLYPYIHIVGVLAYGFLIFEIGTTSLLISLIMILFSLSLYWFYGRIRENREYALLYLVERITDKALVDYSLENELKDVIRERDDITMDRFDKIIDQCEVIDVKGKVTAHQLFESVAEKFADRVGLDSKSFLESMIEREEQSSTVISDSIAIPHIVIKGEKQFDILLIRSAEGITFSDEYNSIHAIFMLVGTRDERNFHLRALSAIAQIIQAPDFEKKWLRAKNAAGLRDIILLGERKRIL